MNEVISGISYNIIVFEAIIIALLSLYGVITTSRYKHARKLDEARAALRQKESMLSMRFMSASVKLGIATALAVQDQKVNGHMDSAMEEAKAAEKLYKELLEEISSTKITK